MDANTLALVLFLLGFGATAGFVFLEVTGMLKHQWLQGFMGLLAVALVAAAAWIALPRLHTLVFGLSLILAIGVLLRVSPSLRRRWQSPITLRWPRTRKTLIVKDFSGAIRPTGELTMTRPPITEEQLRTLAVYEDILDRDKNNLDRLLLVWRYESDFAHVTPLGGWVDFGFDVFNGSILTATIGNRVDGYIVFQGGHQLHDKVNEHSHRTLPHGGGDPIFIRQKLLPEEAKIIIDGASSGVGMEALFDFSGVAIYVSSKTPLGYDGPTTQLKIDRLQKYHIWLDPESVLPEKMILRWERIKQE